MKSNTFNNAKFCRPSKKTHESCLEWQKLAREYNEVNINGDI